MNLRIAAARAGTGTHVALMPDPDDDDLLAMVELTGAPPDRAEAGLFRAITGRRTYRKRFTTRAVPDPIPGGLSEAARLEGAWLRVIEGDEARQRLSALVSEGDGIQWADPSWRRELAAWIHPRHRGVGLTVPWLAAPLAQIVVRTFDMGNGVGARDRELADESPVLAVLGTEGDGTAHWLRAGQALERVLLQAHERGLQASYLNQPIQVPSLRPRLQRLAHRPGLPQALLRLGFPAEELPATPRRSLDEVIE
jgi:hypothetical protein